MSCATLLTTNSSRRPRGRLFRILPATLLLVFGALVSGAWAEPAPAAGLKPEAKIEGVATKGPARTAACTVRVIHALKDGAEFDPQLEPLRPQLTRPPLSAWHRFRLIKQHALTVGTGAPTHFELPDGHNGQLTFMDLVEGGGKKRLRVLLEIRDGAARLLSTKLLMNNGGTMLQAGIRHEKGLLVLGITCQLSQ